MTRDEMHPLYQARKLFYERTGKTYGWSNLPYIEKYTYIREVDGPVTATEKNTRGKKIAPTMVQRMTELLAEGKKQKEVAQELGINAVSVRKFTKEKGSPPIHHKIDKEMVHQIQGMYADGMTSYEIADALEISQSSVMRFTKGMKKKADPNQIRNQEIIGCHKMRMQIKHIAERFHLSESRVKQIIGDYLRENKP
jgi:DNA-binding CsgD family transcriptional regulator